MKQAKRNRKEKYKEIKMKKKFKKGMKEKSNP
jgi:hypothetical protein